MRLVLRPTPNFNARPDGMSVTCVVMHATASKDAQQDLNWLCSPASKASCHDLIDRDATCYRLVDSEKRAWHAGVSSFKGQSNVNDFSIGIELANDNEGEPYPDGQLDVAAALVAKYVKRYGFSIDRVTTHKAIAIPVGRKDDPAPPFDLAAFKVRVQRELLQEPPCDG
jgi:N-acetylmuramoyl-L-alanine amidase